MPGTGTTDTSGPWNLIPVIGRSTGVSSIPVRLTIHNKDLPAVF